MGATVEAHFEIVETDAAKPYMKLVWTSSGKKKTRWANDGFDGCAVCQCDGEQQKGAQTTIIKELGRAS